MSLFTDSTISTMEDLAAHDSGILDVASTEGIDLVCAALLTLQRRW